MDFREGDTAALRRVVGGQWATINDALGAPDQRATGTRKQFDIACPSAPRWWWQILGSRRARDFYVRLDTSMLFRRPGTNLADDQLVVRIEFNCLFDHASAPRRKHYHTAEGCGLTRVHFLAD